MTYDPRVDAALLSMARDIGSINSTVKGLNDKVGEIHKAVYGNGRPGILDRLLTVENHVTRFIGHTTAGRKHTIKVVGWAAAGQYGLILAFKVIYWLITRDWPHLP